MSLQTPPTLLQLAKRSLLKDEALAISALKDLPMELFPPLFKSIFMNKQTTILRMMVAAWPFPCLPVGALMKTSNLEILKALLDGLDLLMTQKVPPNRWKLQELDLRDARHNFWDVWAGIEEGVCSPDDISKMEPVVYHPTPGKKQTMTVLMNLSLVSSNLDNYLNYFCWWAKQRKGALQVICQKLKFWAIPDYNPLELLEVIEPVSIQELEINTCWDLKTLALLAPGLGQMENLQKLTLKEICVPLAWRGDREIKKAGIMKIISQFSKLHKLQHLYFNDVCFLNKRLEQLLGCLESPLETLSITLCMLSRTDMIYLSQCPKVHQLKHLDLSGVTIFNLSHSVLGILLERLAGTLQILELKGCMIVDFQISVILPALSQCSQLTEVNFLKNFLSLSSLRMLLQHTANLKQLTRELYPAPDEVYDEIGDILPDRFEQHCSELMNTIKVIRQPKEVYFVSNTCIDCRECCVYSREAILCSCWQ
ncbi:PRAME family member 12-like [Psammomys obesus]|uniref:PRAME family member 12-like n=1 Tax=Psammomys obesus TaxID=48139 RepID=UPI0024528F49|nr:PRAME family member 12-like [Psammomys obesus]